MIVTVEACSGTGTSVNQDRVYSVRGRIHFIQLRNGEKGSYGDYGIFLDVEQSKE